MKTKSGKLNTVLKDIPEVTKEIPKITGKGGLFDQVSNIFDDNVAALMYGQFSSAVHIDTSVLSQSIERKGNTLIYKGDLDYKLEDFNKSLSFTSLDVCENMVHFL